jgi:hypothetical protein
VISGSFENRRDLMVRRFPRIMAMEAKLNIQAMGFWVVMPCSNDAVKI